MTDNFALCFFRMLARTQGGAMSGDSKHSLRIVSRDSIPLSMTAKMVDNPNYPASLFQDDPANDNSNRTGKGVQRIVDNVPYQACHTLSLCFAYKAKDALRNKNILAIITAIDTEKVSIYHNVMLFYFPHPFLILVMQKFWVCIWSPDTRKRFSLADRDDTNG